MLRHWFGYGWAQPVTHRGWAFVSSALEAWARLTRHRLGGDHWKHTAWERACGLRA